MRDYLSHFIKESIRELLQIDVDPKVEIARNLIHGDYTTNVAMRVGEGSHTSSPIELANMLKANLEEKFQASSTLCIVKIEVIKPGFINFWISQNELLKNLKKLQKSSSMKRKLLPNAEKVFVEYAHPNTHKEMHIGHMRTLITGEAIARILEFEGKEIFRANYQGDVGPHIAKCIYGIEKIMKDESLLLDNIRKWNNYEKAHFLGKGYVRGSQDYDTEKDKIDEINKAIYQKESPIWELYKETRQWSIDYYDEFYKRFSTKFDRLFFESEMVDCSIKIITENIDKIFQIDDNAVIFPGEKYGLHTRVFITKAGNPTYEGKEICNGFKEYEAFHFNRKIHIVGSEQVGYFQVVFKALELLDEHKFRGKQYHLPMGMVQLVGKKISSRTGEVLRIDSLIEAVREELKSIFKNGGVSGDQKEKLLDQIAIGAIKYSVLKVGAKQNVIFDIKKSVSLEGDSGVYLQYSYVRTQSIIRDLKIIDSKIFSLEIIEKEEYILLRLLFQFEDTISQAAMGLSPHIIATYLFELAKEFNLFYQKYRILDVDDELKRSFRIQLTQAVGVVLKEGLYLLGIEAPDKM